MVLDKDKTYKLNGIPVKVAGETYYSHVYRRESVVVQAVHGEPFEMYSSMAGVFYRDFTAVPVDALEEVQNV